MVAHPGRTEAQRRVLDEIGCGNSSPSMGVRTRDALLKAGLIRQCGTKVVGRDRLGIISVPQYEMPIHIHMEWCYSVSEGYDPSDDDEL